MNRRHRWFISLAIWAIASWLLPWLPMPPVLLPLTAAALLLISVAWLLWLAREASQIWSTRQVLAIGIGVFLFWLGLLVCQRTFPFQSPLWRGLFGSLLGTSLLATVTLWGTTLARLIRHANLLPPIAVVVTVVDIWTVLLGGFVQQVQQKAQEGVEMAQKIVEAATVKVPVAGAAKLSGIGLPMMGGGDLFFAAFFFALLWRFGLNHQAAYWLAVLLVFIGMAIAQLPFIPWGIPGLPFIAIAVLLPNWRAFRYTPDERRALLIGGIFLLALLAAFTYAVRQTR